MARTFHGLASTTTRQYDVDVQGSPGARIVIIVNGNTVFDKKPFLGRSRVDFRIEGRLAVLEWRQVGMFHQECYLTLGKREFLLQERDSSGQLQPVLDAEEKSQLQTISTGVGAILFGLFNLMLNYFTLRGEGRIYSRLLIMTPFLLVGGAALIFTRKLMADRIPDARDKLFLVVGTLLMLGVGLSFKGWFVATFRK